MQDKRDVDIVVFPSNLHDDAIVVQVDTSERTKRIRINLNEATIWDGDPEIDGDELYTTLKKVELLEAAAMQLALDLAGLRASLTDTLNQRGIM